MGADNKFLVGMQGDEIILMKPVSRLSKHDALILAAWLVALADDNDTFTDVLAEVHKT